MQATARRWAASPLILAWLFALLALLALTMAPAAAETPGLLGVAQGAGAKAAAPAEVAVPKDLTPDTVGEFVSTLTDGQARHLLVREIGAQVAAQAQAAPADDDTDLIMTFIQGSRNRQAQLSARAEALAEAWEDRDTAFESVFDNLTDLEGWPALWAGLGAFAVVVALGAAAEFLFLRLGAGARARLRTVRPRGLGAQLGFLALRILFDLLGVLVFAVVAYALSFAFFDRFDPMRIFVATYMLVIVASRLVRMVGRFVFAPAAPEARLLPLSDASARYIHRWFVTIGTLAALGFGTLAMLKLLGLPAPLHLTAVVIFGTSMVALLAVAVWHRRHEGAAALAGSGNGREGGLAAVLAQSWHLFAVAYLAIVWVVWAENAFMGRIGQARTVALSLLIVLMVPLAEALARKLLMAGREAAEGRRYRSVVLGGLRAALIAVAVYLLARAWAPDLVRALEGGMGRMVAGAVLEIAVAVLLAVVVWELAKSAIDRHLAGQDADDGPGMQPSARAKTLLPLLRKTILVVLVVMLTMIVLSSIGVDIGPLLAGAGVVGLAIGFGAQALVRDIVAGIFFLIDDAFRVGEYIEMGEIRGEVESMSLRSLRLRHHRGQIFTVPFGELKHITNYNRDWVIYKMPFRVPFDTDVQKVKKLVKQIGQEMLNDETIAPNILETLKSQGVVRMEDTAMIIQLKFMCKPREQFLIRRVAYQKVSEAFAANGIVIAPKGVTVHLDGDFDEDDRKASRQAVRSAATAAAEEAIAEAAESAGADSSIG
ncbi:MAG: mechanosensitive ion channel [Rhodobacterales bacterium]|nr:mechanosensitive ion channel [Rhodobacterales bacterium]